MLDGWARQVEQRDATAVLLSMAMEAVDYLCSVPLSVSAVEALQVFSLPLFSEEGRVTLPHHIEVRAPYGRSQIHLRKMIGLVQVSPHLSIRLTGTYRTQLIQ
jgi:hypothetical protein